MRPHEVSIAQAPTKLGLQDGGCTSEKSEIYLQNMQVTHELYQKQSMIHDIIDRLSIDFNPFAIFQPHSELNCQVCDQ